MQQTSTCAPRAHTHTHTRKHPCLPSEVMLQHRAADVCVCVCVHSLRHAHSQTQPSSRLGMQPEMSHGVWGHNSIPFWCFISPLKCCCLLPFCLVIGLQSRAERLVPNWSTPGSCCPPSLHTDLTSIYTSVFSSSPPFVISRQSSLKGLRMLKKPLSLACVQTRVCTELCPCVYVCSCF